MSKKGTPVMQPKYWEGSDKHVKTICKECGLSRWVVNDEDFGCQNGCDNPEVDKKQKGGE